MTMCAFSANLWISTNFSATFQSGFFADIEYNNEKCSVPQGLFEVEVAVVCWDLKIFDFMYY